MKILIEIDVPDSYLGYYLNEAEIVAAIIKEPVHTRILNTWLDRVVKIKGICSNCAKTEFIVKYDEEVNKCTNCGETFEN